MVFVQISTLFNSLKVVVDVTIHCYHHVAICDAILIVLILVTGTRYITLDAYRLLMCFRTVSIQQRGVSVRRCFCDRHGWWKETLIRTSACWVSRCCCWCCCVARTCGRRGWNVKLTWARTSLRPHQLQHAAHCSEVTLKKVVPFNSCAKKSASTL